LAGLLLHEQGTQRSQLFLMPLLLLQQGLQQLSLALLRAMCVFVVLL
jgi:hypothetical protein